MSAALFKKAKQKALYLAILGMFSNNVPGLVLDSNDWGPTGTGGTGVVFQDLSGTAVTAMEQPVQLILDKSQGLKLGSELVVNGSNLVDTSSWVAQNSTLVAVGGQLQVTNTSGALYGSGGQVVSGLTVGKMYKVVVTFTKGTSDGRLDINGVSNVVARSTSGVMTWYFVATGTTAVVSCVNTTLSVGAASSYGPISCKSIAGNHAYVSASANRPVISARYNLQIKTEDYADSAWSKTATTIASISPITAPIGGRSAYLATQSASGLVGGTVTTAISGSSYTSTQFFYAGTATWIEFGILDNGLSNGGRGWYNIATGAKGSSGVIGAGSAPTDYSITAVAGFAGWYLLSYKGAAPSTAIRSYWRAVGSDGSSTAVAATYYPFGSDLRPSDQATGLIPTYQRVNTATDYDWSPAFPPMIRGNGSNQFLQTSSIDFTSTNKMTVWSGVRKVSDSSVSPLVELSTQCGAGNPGSFNLLTPASTITAGANDFQTAGTLFTSARYVKAAPTTMVISGLGNIAAPSAILRINGTQVASDSTSQGTGNYGNYPLYILSRAGSSLFFSGGFNSIIILGAAATAAQISTTEAYCNQKLRAY